MQNTLLEESASTITGYRLSPQQKQLWQEQKRSAHDDVTPSYSAQAVLAVNGSLVPDRVREAATAVVARHEILRTSFPLRPGMRTLMQVIHEKPSIVWREEDFSSELSDAQQSLLAAVIKDESVMRFPDAGPSFRVTMIRVATEEYRVVLSVPILCADEVSLGIIAREIFEAYTATSEFNPDAVQYIQFSEWQHELAESDGTEAAHAFWLEQQSAPALNLPLAVLRSCSGETRQRARLDLGRNVSLRLERVAGECKVSMETILLACWCALLWRLTAQETFSIACVFDGRQYEELQDCIGLFARALPLSARFHERQTLAALAQQLEERRQTALEWQECFDNKAEVTVGYEYVKRSVESNAAPALKWRVLETRSAIHQPQLGLRCETTGETVALELVSGSSGDVELLLRRMQMFVAAAVENINQPIDALPIVTKDERDYLVHKLSRADDETIGKSQNFVRTFETIAERFPNHLAVVGEDEELSYHELDRRSNQLAHYLRRLGVRPETRVAICMERSAKIVLAILGVLKVGGAYVPLDLNYSPKQLSFMLEDAAPPVLLTEQVLLPLVPRHGGRNVCLDSEYNMIAAESTAKPRQTWSDENLAYVIYTSGSTGVPKGVGIEHRQLQNYLRGIAPRLNLHPGASYATVSTFAADLGHTAIFSALSTGGCLHVISQDRATNAEALAEYFGRLEIDCLKIVPSHLEALLETTTPAKVLPRRCLVLGGEALRTELVQKIAVLAPDCRIINHYGPTETTVGVLSYPVSDTFAGAAATLPLGRPLAGTEIYLLDRNLSPAPFGVAAALYVGGESVSRGYLNHPEMTAERFVPNPFGSPGTRLYQTGDLGRYQSGGDIEFLGRNDDQVKIHGYRVEPGEIEAALLQHECVREATVIVREDVRGEKQLVAYIVCRQNIVPTADELRNFLRERLAEHLIPSEFVRLKSLPLNPNGKVDRRSLPEAEGVSLELNRSFVEPRTAVEEVLADIWSDVLKQERVGVEDNFFALGGHSLAAMQVMARIRRIFQAELPLRAVFEATTVALLAQAIIENETEPGLMERKARLLKKLEAMSPAEKEALRTRHKAVDGAEVTQK
ncbi:MAG TPA: amino acid adenylation domain-containing protein [Pyrinomonadaceae bacterium]|nr:amino acid adenylation domain-containing protein [Pyrinomonadaceae bacterium]